MRYQWVEPSSSETRRKDEQPGVGVGLVGEPAEHDREQRALDRRATADPGRQRLDVAQRAGRVAEAEGEQALAGRLGAEPGLGRAELGGGREQRPVEEPLVEPAHLAGRGLTVGHDGPLRVRRGGPWHGPAGAGRPRHRHEVRAPEPVELDAVLEAAQVR